MTKRFRLNSVWVAGMTAALAVSSIGVVASLWYLAIQVHRSTRITRLAAQDAASTALRDVTRPFAENADNSRIWRIGLENLEALSADDKARFFHFARPSPWPMLIPKSGRTQAVDAAARGAMPTM